MKNKKGSGIVDLVFIVLFFIVIVFVAVLSYMFINIFSTSMESQEDVPDAVKNMTSDFDNRFNLFFDAGIVLFIFILWLGLIATSFILDNHPVFFIFFLLLAFIVVFISVPIVNVIYDLSVNNTLQPYFDQFPMTMFLINQWLFLLVFFIITTGIALYAKFNVVGGGGY